MTGVKRERHPASGRETPTNAEIAKRGGDVMNVHPQLVKFLAAYPWVVGMLLAWEMLWKGLAMWRAARRDQPLWFIAVFVLNTLGLLPIIYVAFFARRRADLVSGS